MADMEEKKMKTKKEKKTKLGDNGVRENELATPEPSILENQETQKDKKKKKKKNAQEESAEEHSATNEAAQDAKKKKKRKNNEQEETQDNGTETNGSNSEEKPKKKKKRQAEDTNISLGNYIPHADVENMSQSAAESYRQEHNLALLPTEAADFYKPITAFAQLTPSLQDYCPEVLQYLESKKFPHPSPIQVRNSSIF
jgi:hypothetical protein